jgi:hypothetical protein
LVSIIGFTPNERTSLIKKMKFFLKNSIKFLTVCVFMLWGKVDNFAQTTYYSKASGNANSVSTWGTNTDGSGTNPADFISGDVFIVRNGSSLTTSGAWNIDDAGIDNGGVLRIATGGLLTASHAINFTSSSSTGTTFEVENNGTYRHSLSTNINTTILTATNLNFITGSNFEIYTTGTHTNGAGAVFSNFTVTNSATVTFSSTILYVANVLTINSGATLRFSNTGITSYLSDGGSMTTSGTGLLRTASTSTTNLPSSINWSFQVNYDGTGAQRIQTGTYSTLNASGGNRTISSGATVTISGTFTPGSGTYTLTGSTIEYSGNGSANIPNLTYNNLTISGTGTKSLTTDLTINGILSITNASGFLAINGNTLTLNGTTDLSNGKLIGSATSKLTVGGSTGSTTNLNFSQSGTNNQLQSLTLNRTGGGGATLLSNIDIINTLTLTNGILATNNNTLALRSTSISNTARVATVGSGASINYSSVGGIRSERFLSQGYRSFKDLGSGIYTFSNYIFDNWQEAGATTTGLGTHITGLAGSAGVDPTTGLDKTQQGNVSMYTYNGTTYPSITNTKTTRLDPYRGYRILIRGDRTVDLWQVPTPTTMNSSTVLRTTGQLIYGDVTYSTSGVSNGVYSSSYALNSSSATGFSLIANPYWAPISWGKILDNTGTNNIQSTYWYFDPTLGVTGVYATWLRTGGSGSETGASNGVGNTNNFIQPGQAIFIRNNNSTSPSVKITESNKDISSSAVSVFNTTSSTPLNKLGIVLQRFVEGRGQVVFDGSTLLFGANNSNTVSTNEDAGKITNGGENLAIVNNTNGTTLLSIESRKPAVAVDTINLRLWQMANNENYTLNLIPSAFNPNGNLAFLRDRFLQKELFIRNDIDTLKQPFTINNSDSSSFFNRFAVIFKQPYSLGNNINSIELKGSLTANIASLSWNIPTNTPADQLFYDLEKSSNGIEFTVVKRMYADSTTNQYSYVDSAANLPKNYYRIKTYRTDAGFWNSNLVLLENEDSIKTISFYPNPVTNNRVNIQFNKLKPANYQFTLLDMKGNIVLTKQIQHIGATSTQQISFTKPLSSGTYKAVLINMETKKRFTGTILVGN